MKKIFLIYAFLLFLIILSCSKNDGVEVDPEPISVKDFKYSSELAFPLVFEKVFDEQRNVTYYVVNTIHDNKQLITSYDSKSQQLVPVVFIYDLENKVQLADVEENRVFLAVIKEDGSFTSFIDPDKDAVKMRCLGGSTMGCIELAVESCWNDWSCRLACAAVYKQCLGAIAAACFIHCQ
jgi:hypothetical protein